MEGSKNYTPVLKSDQIDSFKKKKKSECKLSYAQMLLLQKKNPDSPWVAWPLTSRPEKP